jgi:NAD(P)-dependent dehydrogenase (short-subunit alcohol dehydrogenase family)
VAGPMAGRVAFVTGAASGIGRASAAEFAAAGAAVAIVDVDRAGLAATGESLRAGGAETLELPADVTVAADVHRAVTATVEAFGRLDFAHNNAGVPGPYLPLDAYEEKDFRRVIDVDLIGVWLCLKYQIVQLREHGGGAIVNTSSMLGKAGMRSNGAYTAAKHAVHGLTRCAALEAAEAGIRVNAIAPGVTRTGMTSEVSDELLRSVPLRRIAEPEEIAAEAVWLCSDAASYVTGAVLVADGGYLA